MGEKKLDSNSVSPARLLIRILQHRKYFSNTSNSYYFGKPHSNKSFSAICQINNSGKSSSPFSSIQHHQNQVPESNLFWWGCNLSPVAVKILLPTGKSHASKSPLANTANRDRVHLPLRRPETTVSFSSEEIILNLGRRRQKTRVKCFQLLQQPFVKPALS